MSFWDMKVTCIDPGCWKYGSEEIVNGRKPIIDHVKKKPRRRIIEILKPFNIVNDFEILTTYSLINILTDCCYANVYRKLLKELEQEKQKGVSTNAI